LLENIFSAEIEGLFKLTKEKSHQNSIKIFEFVGVVKRERR